MEAHLALKPVECGGAWLPGRCRESGTGRRAGLICALSRESTDSCKEAFRFPGVLILILLGAIFCGASEIQANENDKPRIAKLKVSGCGLLQNRELAQMIRLSRADRAKVEFFDANFIEDAALTIISKAIQDGYLDPRLSVRLDLADGSKQRYQFNKDLDVLLPRSLAAKAARFRVRRGVRFHYQELDISGLSSIPLREAEGFFLPAGFVIRSKRARIYTPLRLRHSVAALRGALARKGYADAVVTFAETARNEKTGAVNVQVQVKEGLPTIVRSVKVESFLFTNTPARPGPISRPNVPYSRAWLQEFSLSLRTNEYRRGYPDATVEMITLQRETNETRIQLDLLAHLITGSRIKTGQVKFAGYDDTALSVLESRVHLEEGEWLDRLEAERARVRLSRLGIFDTVTLRYEPASEQTRDVIYEVKESKTLELSLLLGWGSYERLRGGLELAERNAFGLAHDVRFRVVQSFKASSGDFRYTIPDVFKEEVNVFARAAGLRREEVSFTRRELSGGIGVQKYLRRVQTDASLRYDYQVLNAQDAPVEPPSEIGLKDTRAAAFILDLARDRRDNPLVPRSGLKVSSTLEFASAALGGEVDYQRLLFGGSWNHDLGGGRYLHLNAEHGLTFTGGGKSEDLPFNKRFFPGGENSIRGFQQGEAAPQNARGESIGAETFLQGNVELEQYLTANWSLIVFFDVVGFAARRRDYPFDETLYSAGGGIRWKTVVGPLRLEYGHNLNPRREDPAGTFHFSIGFPF